MEGEVVQLGLEEQHVHVVQEAGPFSVQYLLYCRWILLLVSAAAIPLQSPS
jgi:hypothetical protein